MPIMEHGSYWNKRNGFHVLYLTGNKIHFSIRADKTLLFLIILDWCLLKKESVYEWLSIFSFFYVILPTFDVFQVFLWGIKKVFNCIRFLDKDQTLVLIDRQTIKRPLCSYWKGIESYVWFDHFHITRVVKVSFLLFK